MGFQEISSKRPLRSKKKKHWVGPLGSERTTETNSEMIHKKSFLDLGPKQIHALKSGDIQRIKSVNPVNHRLYKPAQDSKLRRHKEKCLHRWRRYKSKSYKATAEGINAHAGSNWGLAVPTILQWHLQEGGTIKRGKVGPTRPEFWCLQKQGSRGKREKVHRN